MTVISIGNRNSMNWPRDKDYKCAICGSTMLEWGIAHATCYCTDCGTPYRMRDKNGERVTAPICQVKENWMEVTKAIWKQYETLDCELDRWLEMFDKLGLDRPNVKEV